MQGLYYFIINCFIYRKILFGLKNIHYGWLLVFTKIKLQQDKKLTLNKKFYEKKLIIDIINELLKDIDELINMLNEEESTSHVRSKLFKDKYKKFWSKYSIHSLELYE